MIKNNRQNIGNRRHIKNTCRIFDIYFKICDRN